MLFGGIGARSARTRRRRKCRATPNLFLDLRSRLRTLIAGNFENNEARRACNTSLESPSVFTFDSWKKNCLATFKTKIYQFQNRSFYSIIGEKVGLFWAQLYLQLQSFLVSVQNKIEDHTVPYFEAPINGKEKFCRLGYSRNLGCKTALWSWAV